MLRDIARRVAARGTSSGESSILSAHKRATGPTPPQVSPHMLPNKAERILKSLLGVSPEVIAALKENKPVVGLETTIYTHGFPFPDNVKLARDLEKIVRDNGGVPATVGVLDGQIRVGMTTKELTRLASSAGHPETRKVSRRDIPYIVGMGLAGRRLNGGTTVAGTMHICDLAGIRVFGTGGLGGVHRDGQDTMDVSADLTELGRTNVAVISSGCKSFLDLPRTLEYLETQGVTVSTFADGRSGEVDFPSFYSRESGIKSPMTIQNAEEAAAIILAARYTSAGGLLFANPIPEEYSIPREEIDAAMNQAVQEAADQGFHGHLNTPFILARIKELTQGNSIPANRALIESNVRMATKVAVEYAKLDHSNDAHSSLIPSKIERAMAHIERLHKSDDIVVFGSVALDLSCDLVPQSASNAALSAQAQAEQSALGGYIPKTSNITSITESVGGVGHNVALAAQRVVAQRQPKTTVHLVSFVGSDRAGTFIRSRLRAEGLSVRGVRVVRSQSTAQYVALNGTNKDLVLAAADMSILKDCNISSDRVAHETNKAKWVVVDANWNPLQIQFLLQGLQANKQSSNLSYNVAYEPVSVPKAAGLFTNTIPEYRLKPFPHHSVNLATPNQHELAAMHSTAKENGFFESPEWWETINSIGISSSGARDRFVQITNVKLVDEGIPIQAVQLLPLIPTILTKLGSEGVLLTTLLQPTDPLLTDPAAAPYILSRSSNGSEKIGGVYMRLFPAAEVVTDAVSVNGVGDTFLGVLIAGLSCERKLDEELIGFAQKAAVMTLRSAESVSPELEGVNWFSEPAPTEQSQLTCESSESAAVEVEVETESVER